MTRQTWMTLTLAATIGLGCAKDDKSKANPYAKAAQQQRDMADKDDFGTKNEPAIMATTHLAAGGVAESQGNVQNAIDQYQKAVGVDPKLTDAWFKLAILRARTQQYPTAVEAWKSYLKLAPNDPTGYANLGFTYDLAGKASDAESAYKHGIDLNPTHTASRVNYGLMLIKAGRIDEAKAQFGAVLPPAAVHYNLASAYEQQGKTELARAEYETSLKLDPTFKPAKTRLAELPVATVTP